MVKTRRSRKKTNHQKSLTPDEILDEILNINSEEISNIGITENQIDNPIFESCNTQAAFSMEEVRNAGEKSVDNLFEASNNILTHQCLQEFKTPCLALSSSVDLNTNKLEESFQQDDSQEPEDDVILESMGKVPSGSPIKRKRYPFGRPKSFIWESFVITIENSKRCSRCKAYPGLKLDAKQLEKGREWLASKNPYFVVLFSGLQSEDYDFIPKSMLSADVISSMDPCSWWKAVAKSSNRVPRGFVDLVEELLRLPASTSGLERSLFTLGRIMCKERSRLGVDKAEKLCFLSFHSDG